MSQNLEDAQSIVAEFGELWLKSLNDYASRFNYGPSVSPQLATEYAALEKLLSILVKPAASPAPIQTENRGPDINVKRSGLRSLMMSEG